MVKNQNDQVNLKSQGPVPAHQDLPGIKTTNHLEIGIKKRKIVTKKRKNVITVTVKVITRTTTKEVKIERGHPRTKIQIETLKDLKMTIRKEKRLLKKAVKMNLTI